MTDHLTHLAATERAIEEAERRGRIEGMRAALQHLRMAEHAVDARIAIGGEIDRLELRGADQWPILTTARARLVQGEVEYGDASFAGPLGTTVDEIRQEIADVIGWACVLARKLDRLGQAVHGVDAWPPR